jgi:hypothetical protein
MNTTNNKEMTKEEALEFLKNKKILCRNEKESFDVRNKFLELQKKLLNLKCVWHNANNIYYLFFLNDINFLIPVENYKDWIEDPREELKVQDLLDIQIKEENPITSIKTENMKELKIEVPEGYEIDKGKSTFEKIIFKKIKVELPKTWEEFCNQNSVGTEYFITEFSSIANTDINKRVYSNNKNLLSTKEDAEAHLALMQLHRLRDVYRQGWVPDWNDGTGKYCILFNPDNLDIVTYTRAPHFLAFQSREIAEEFIKNFKDLIEKVKVLIS